MRERNVKKYLRIKEIVREGTERIFGLAVGEGKEGKVGREKWRGGEGKEERKEGKGRGEEGREGKGGD